MDGKTLFSELVAKQVAWEAELSASLEEALSTHLRQFYSTHSQWLASVCISAHHNCGFQCLNITPSQKLVDEVLASFRPGQCNGNADDPRMRQLWRGRKQIEPGDEVEPLVPGHDFTEGFGTKTTKPFFDAVWQLNTLLKKGEFLILLMDKQRFLKKLAKSGLPPVYQLDEIDISFDAKVVDLG